MTNAEVSLRNLLKQYYAAILVACLQSGKWTMTEAKKEALCAIKNHETDDAELDRVIDELINTRIFAQEPTTTEGE